MIDISLVLNFHRESKFLFRTLLSIKDATDYARLHGIVVELIIVLDRPDALTRQTLQKFELGVFDHAKVVEVDRGSLGLARNDGIIHARGKYVRLCDGDDLISFNLITAMYFEAEHLGPHAIMVAEWLFAFGLKHFSIRYDDLDIVTPMSLMDINPCTSQLFSHRSLFEALRFEDLGLSVGYAYEDWHFATEAVALGHSFYAARDTTFFYRQHSESLFTKADAISVRHISPSILFTPSVYLRVCAESYRRYLNGGVRREPGDARRYIDSAVGRQHFGAANLIEPAIDPKLNRQAGYCYSIATVSNLNIGRRYYEICEKLGDQTYSDIFILPEFGADGVERYISNIILTICSLREDVSILLILGESHPENEWLGRFPACVQSVDLAPYLDEIADKGRDIITLKLIQSLGVRARLHVSAGAFGERFFGDFGRALEGHKRIFYRFGQARRVDGDRTFFEPSVFQFLSEHIENIDAVVSDNETVIDYDRQRIGVTPEKWRFLPTLFEAPIDRAKVNSKLSAVSKRIIWASRLTTRTRPEVLLATAKKALTLCPELGFDVYGDQTPDFDVARFSEFPNLVYNGAYGSFEDIAKGEFICFLYTSAYDGIPTILLEAAGMGLPIVAPDVGGIGEFIESEGTGILLPHVADIDQMADAYIKAIIRLGMDPSLRAKLGRNAYDRAVSKFGATSYRKTLSTILGLTLG